MKARGAFESPGFFDLEVLCTFLIDFPFVPNLRRNEFGGEGRIASDDPTVGLTNVCLGNTELEWIVFVAILINLVSDYGPPVAVVGQFSVALQQFLPRIVYSEFNLACISIKVWSFPKIRNCRPYPLGQYFQVIQFSGSLKVTEANIFGAIIMLHLRALPIRSALIEISTRP